jgi:TRAP-type C4-dicarboxylate transport system permease small subunit
VVGRYGFGRSISGADELQVYIMVWMAFGGAAVVSWRRSHLRMDVLVRFLPLKIQKILKILEAVVLIVMAGFALWQSWSYTAQMLALGRNSDVAAIPMWIPHGAVVVGFGLIALIGVWQAVSLRNR